MYQYFTIHDKGHEIHAKMYYTQLQQIRKAVVFGTGFAGHKDNNAANAFADMLLSENDDTIVIVFNWPAHGDDEKKKLLLSDCDAYLEAVISYLHHSFNIDELYAYATSFGGYLVLKYIYEHDNPFLRIALRCPAVNMCEVLTETVMKDDELERIRNNEELPIGFDRKVIIDKNLLEQLQTYDIRRYDYRNHAGRILIMHGTADEVVPFREGKKFAADNRIRFIPFEGTDHRFQKEEDLFLAHRSVLQFFADTKRSDQW